MLPSPRPSREKLAAVKRVKAWTRARFSLDDDVAILVAEIACGLPGCPPLETVVTFWTAPDRRHAFKVFKATLDVCEDDLPPAFMKNAIVDEGDDLDCC
jgi:hypothetical protein